MQQLVLVPGVPFQRPILRRTLLLVAMTASTAGCHLRSPVPSGPFTDTATERLVLRPLTGLSPALDRIDQGRWPLDGRIARGTTGRGVVVYIFDAGVDSTVDELRGRVRAGYDGFPAVPLQVSHGTAVASVAAGRTLGVAPDAEIVSVRIAKNERTGDLQKTAAAARWVAEDVARHGRPAVANWSFSSGVFGEESPHIGEAIRVLDDAGVLIVVSAGNTERDACLWTTARDTRTLTVGAVALIAEPTFPAFGPRASGFDQYVAGTGDGACVDLFAPGVNVPTVPPPGTPSHLVAWRTGTSFATPLAAGAAALYLEQHPATPPAALRALLREHATLHAVKGATAPGARLLRLLPDAGRVP